MYIEKAVHKKTGELIEELMRQVDIYMTRKGWTDDKYKISNFLRDVGITRMTWDNMKMHRTRITLDTFVRIVNKIGMTTEITYSKMPRSAYLHPDIIPPKEFTEGSK